MNEKEWNELINDLYNVNNIKKRMLAYEKLSKVSDVSRIQALYELLRDEDYSIREVVAEPLASLEGVNALPTLFQALRQGFIDGHDNDSLIEVICGLVEEKSEESLPILLDMMNNEDQIVRANAVWGLSFVKPLVEPQIFLSVLKGNSDTVITIDAIGALGNYKENEEVLFELINKAKNSGEEIREAIIHTLGFFDNEYVISGLEKIKESCNDSDQFILEGMINVLSKEKIRLGSKKLDKKTG